MWGLLYATPAVALVSIFVVYPFGSILYHAFTRWDGIAPAQWVGLLESGAWLRYGQQANRCAFLLESRLREIPGLEILWDCEANSVFVMFPETVRDRLRAKGWRFYTFIGGGARSFDFSTYARNTAAWPAPS